MKEELLVGRSTRNGILDVTSSHHAWHRCHRVVRIDGIIMGLNVWWEKALNDVIASKLYSSCDSIECLLRENQLISKKWYFCKKLGRHDGDTHYHVIANFYLANSSSNSSNAQNSLNPTWMYLESEGDMRMPSCASKWSPWIYLSSVG